MALKITVTIEAIDTPAPVRVDLTAISGPLTPEEIMSDTVRLARLAATAITHSDEEPRPF